MLDAATLFADGFPMPSTTVIDTAELITCTWLKNSGGPKGGRPIERVINFADRHAMQAFLELMPTLDRLRLPDGREVPGELVDRTSPSNVLPLMEHVDSEALAVEFERRSSRAMCDDMLAVRREIVASTTDTIKCMRAQTDAMMALAEKVIDLALKQKPESEGEGAMEGWVFEAFKHLVPPGSGPELLQVLKEMRRGSRVVAGG